MRHISKAVCLFALLMLAGSLHAQHVGPANLTAQGTTCGASSTQSVTVTAIRPIGGLTFTLSGTWSGTVTFYASGDNASTWQTYNVTASNSTSVVTTSTGNGTFKADGSGFTNFCAMVTTYSSGTVVASMNLSQVAAGGGSSGSVGGSTAWSSVTAATNTNTGTYTQNQTGVFTDTQENDQFVATLNGGNGASCTDNPTSFKFTIALVGNVCTPTGSTGVTNAINIGVYGNAIQNNSGNTGQFGTIFGTGTFGGCLEAAANNECEGAVGSVEDTASLSGQILVGVESDAQLNDTATTGYGYLFSMRGNSQPGADTYPAYDVQVSQGTAKPTSGYRCESGSITGTDSYGSAGACLVMKPTTAGASEHSSAIAFQATDGSSNPVPLEVFIVSDPAGGGLARMTSAQNYIQVVWPKVPPTTFATIPFSCDSDHNGTLADITDGPATQTFNATVTAGGNSTPSLLWCDGTNWRLR